MMVPLSSVMLLLALLLCSISTTCSSDLPLCSRNREPDPTLLLFTRSEIATILVDARKQLTQQERREFLQKIRDVPTYPLQDSSCTACIDSKLSNPPQDPQKLVDAPVCAMTKVTNTFPEDIFNTVCPNQQVKEDDDPAEEAIKEAIELAKSVVGKVGEVTSSILADIENTRNEIAQNQLMIEDLTEEPLDEYTTLVASVSVTLNQAEIVSKTIYEEILSLVTIALEIIDEEFNQPDDIFVESIRDTQFLLSIALESSAERLDDLAVRVSTAQTDIVIAKDQSNLFAQKLENNLANKNGFINSRASTIRAKAYGGCAACVLFPPTCAVCYGAAVPIIETQISDLKNDLRNYEKLVLSIRDEFLSLGNNCELLACVACNQFEEFTLVAGKLVTTERLIQSDRASIWKRAVPRRLMELKEILENALSTSDDSLTELKEILKNAILQRDINNALAVKRLSSL